MGREEALAKFRKYADETKERVDYGIEHYRKGNFCIRVTDKDGNPVKNAKIKLNQKSHEFKYGANIFMLDELEPGKNELYKKYFKECFNMATLPFYWNDLEPEKGKPRYAKDSYKVYRRPAPDLCMEFCEANGIEPREHALAYEHFFPEWAKSMTTGDLKRELEKHFKEVAERYADKIPTIEVTNEMGWEFGEGASAFYESEDYIEWCFKTAEKYFPNNNLTINDWLGAAWPDTGRSRTFYYMLIERALSKGARIDSIGLQYHMFFKSEDEIDSAKNYYNPRHLFEIMDRYADFNKPLQITEVTIPAYSESEKDEGIQAEIIRSLYKIWFSHKNMEQIIYWNLVDGYAAFAPQGDMTVGENYYYGGLLRFDMSPKPAYYAIKDLFEKEWHTQTEVSTDDEGNAYFKGFYGDYDAEIGGNKLVVSALKNIRTDKEYNKLIMVKI